MAWSFQPGSGSAYPAEPPKGQGLRAVMLVHPDCPCTGASLKLLADSVSASPSRIDTLILVASNPRESKNISLAKTIPHARIEFLSAQKIYQQFGISTSGHILMWKNQDLIFSGGITDARGEGGAGDAFRAFSSALQGKPLNKEIPVFGCRVYEEGKGR